MINGYVLCENKIVARIDDDMVSIIDDAKCPLLFKRISDINVWLNDRSFDITRTNLRVLRRMFKVSGLSAEDLVSTVHASTITDRFWLKLDEEADLSYDDVKFQSDHLFRAALEGNFDVFRGDISIHSPEFTNLGSLEKGWKKLSDSWYLYKNEMDIEEFNELFCEQVSALLGIQTATYEKDSSYIRTKDFTNFGELMLEPIKVLVDADRVNDYIYCYDAIKNAFGLDIASVYVNLMFFDAIVRNMDRHEFNYGVLRDCHTGEVLSLAPNFDFNNCLFARSMPDKVTISEDTLIKDFVELYERAGNNVPLLCPNPDELRLATEHLSSYGDLYESALKLVEGRLDILKQHLLNLNNISDSFS